MMTKRHQVRASVQSKRLRASNRALRTRLVLLQNQCLADSDAIHQLCDECRDLRRKCKCMERGLLP